MSLFNYRGENTMRQIKIIKKDKLSSSKWSGGTTTQLYIYPENELYENRNFTFRISSAKVDLEESTFTKLPNIKRRIMILDGKLKLIHENYHSVTLEKFQQDTFYGDWNTKSYGKVTDFNLMLNDNADGFIEYINLKNEKIINPYKNDKYNNTTEVFYCVRGKINISINNEREQLEAGDVAIIKNIYNLEIKLNNMDKFNSDIIRTKVNY
ncbi:MULTISPECIES: HutD family protein [Terrisporobacter]|uniref:HutD family protein n=1 Tax=Terrisporobacter TaxID=1505652 RepID=UPI00265AC0E0|nr:MULTISPECIES: HutD family protein [Terrisporobacter]MCC3668931.1 HutD family protein [Terrisporobacter mayombei]MDU6983991.1 HutD family protein [Terrisporobacter othiniensis]